MAGGGDFKRREFQFRRVTSGLRYASVSPFFSFFFSCFVYFTRGFYPDCVKHDGKEEHWGCILFTGTASLLEVTQTY